MAERQLQIDIQYSEQLGITRNDLPFHLEKMKADKRGKLACNLNDKEHLKIVHDRNLKQDLNYGLKLKKVPRVIKFNQKDWLKLYIDMYTKLPKK